MVRSVPGCCNKKTALRFRKAVPGAPSAGALRKRSSGAFLATGPREAKRSARANAEPAPKGMVHLVAPVRCCLPATHRGLSRGLKTVHWTVFAGRDVRRPARAVLVPDGAPLVRSVPGCCNKKTALRFRKAAPGAPSGTRTQDPLIKSQLLYQLS